MVDPGEAGGQANQTELEGGTPAGGTSPGSLAFVASAWAMLAVLLLFSPALLVLLGWFTEGYAETASSVDVSHRVHEVAFGVLFTIAAIGAGSQLRNPGRNTAGFCQLGLTLIALAAFVNGTSGWDAGLLLYLLPLAGMVVLRSHRGTWTVGPPWWSALAIGAVFLPPALEAIWSHLDRAMTQAQNHTTHWSAMATFQVVLVGLVVIVFLRLPGYRLSAFTAGGAAIFYGVASLLFPFDASSHRPAYSAALIIWGVGWVLLAAGARRARSVRRRLPAIVTVVLALPVLLIASMLWSELDRPPNVPHRPNPEQPLVMAAEVDRATCLSCHEFKVGGAPIPPHVLTEPCEGSCWGGRTDCAGCHQIDPALGGYGTQLDVDVEGPARWVASMPGARVVLEEGTLHRAKLLAAGP
jgi:hypothetical protein